MNPEILRSLSKYIEDTTDAIVKINNVLVSIHTRLNNLERRVDKCDIQEPSKQESMS